jgi:hypothetical protein
VAELFAALENDTSVGLYKLNPVDPQLDSAWFQPSSLSSEKLASKLCFQMQLVPLHHGALAN